MLQTTQTKVEQRIVVGEMLQQLNTEGAEYSVQFLQGFPLALPQSDNLGHVAVGGGIEKPDLSAQDLTELSSGVDQLLDSVQF